MNFFYTLFFSISFITIFAQNNQLIVSDDVSDGEQRSVIVGQNLNNGNKGFTSFTQFSGSGSNETIGAFITYNSKYSAIPDFNSYVSILSGSSTQEGRGINLIGLKDYAKIRFFLGGTQPSDVKMILNNDGNLGIGNSNPITKVHIEKSASDGLERTLLLGHNTDNGNKGFTSFTQFSGSGSNETIGAFITYNSNYNAIPDYNGYVSILSGSSTREGRGINLIGQKDYANIRFFLGGTQTSDLKMILDSDGDLGIGTTNPSAKLQVKDGDIYIEDINKGVIMKSPDGNCWRITIDNTGAMISNLLYTCPCFYNRLFPTSLL